MLIETNIDDMNPQVYDYLIEKLMRARRSGCIPDPDRHEKRQACDPAVGADRSGEN